MKKIRSKKQLIKFIYELVNSEDYARAITFGMNLSIIVIKEFIGSDCDYVDVEYDAKSKTLFGRPVYLSSKLKSELLAKNSEIGVYCVECGDLSAHILKKKVAQDKLHHYFNGLSACSFENQDIRHLPDFITQLAPDSLKDCVSRHKLELPTHLLIQLVAAGLKVEEGCKVVLSRTGSFGLTAGIQNIVYHPPVTSKARNKSINYIDICNLFKTGERIRIYKDRLCVIKDELPSQELEYVNNFHYKTFYNNHKDFIISLLLVNYNIISTSDVSEALIAVYKEKFMQN